MMTLPYEVSLPTDVFVDRSALALGSLVPEHVVLSVTIPVVSTRHVHLEAVRLTAALSQRVVLADVDTFWSMKLNTNIISGEQ